LTVPYVRKFLPYFFEYSQTGDYPDKRGRLFQPIKLLEAISVCNTVVIERQQKNTGVKNG
jgi:hypothetical protein